VVGLTALPVARFIGPPAAVAQVKEVGERLRPAGIDGSLAICGTGRTPDAARTRFMELAGGAKARLVVLTASDDAATEIMDAWKPRNPADVAIVHVPAADNAKLTGLLRDATGVWVEDDPMNRIAGAIRGTAIEDELRSLLRRNGVLGGAVSGLDLLPGTVLDLRDGRQRLLQALVKQPGRLGLSLASGAALAVRGRQLRVLGDGTVAACLAGSATRQPRTIELKPGAVSDLTILVRASAARNLPPFPPKDAPVPEVPNGALVIVGGAGCRPT
jgi:cyanophycinase-like exopeptidase